MSKSLIDHSKTIWTVPDEKGSPGDINLIIGCLQRIATASELTAKNYNQLLTELDYYKKRHMELLDNSRHLESRIRSLKGQNTQLRNKLKSK